ncbi:hypothetical protein NKG94_30625 [Micromonospora sp. M12]
MENLTTRGRATRLGATALGLVLLVVGTFWGSDDDFRSARSGCTPPPTRRTHPHPTLASRE